MKDSMLARQVLCGRRVNDQGLQFVALAGSPACGDASRLVPSDERVVVSDTEHTHFCPPRRRTPGSNKFIAEPLKQSLNAASNFHTFLQQVGLHNHGVRQDVQKPWHRVLLTSLLAKEKGTYVVNRRLEMVFMQRLNHNHPLPLIP